MKTAHKIKVFSELSELLQQQIESGEMDPVFYRAEAENGWFTVANSRRALEAIIQQFLQEDKLTAWLSAYNIVKEKEAKTVALIMAGNLPLVGFHDLLCVLMSGHKAMIKLSSKDKVLPQYIISELYKIAPEFEYLIQMENGTLAGFDAVIATGSGNTLRYFEYYFGKYPNILRHNRNSVAVLDGTENKEELHKLGDDVLSYFGLGCRNVSMVWAPRNYSFIDFYDNIESYAGLFDNHKYKNNYDYHKSLLLLNKEPHLDNNFLMLRESMQMASPMATLHCTYYDDINEVKLWLAEQAANIQCIVAHSALVLDAIPFGSTQMPALNDYADNVDTMNFLLGL
jgi:hypothetical protein